MIAAKGRTTYRLHRHCSVLFHLEFVLVSYFTGRLAPFSYQFSSHGSQGGTRAGCLQLDGERSLSMIGRTSEVVGNGPLARMSSIMLRFS